MQHHNIGVSVVSVKIIAVSRRFGYSDSLTFGQ